MHNTHTHKHTLRGHTHCRKKHGAHTDTHEQTKVEEKKVYSSHLTHTPDTDPHTHSAAGVH